MGQGGRLISAPSSCSNSSSAGPGGAGGGSRGGSSGSICNNGVFVAQVATDLIAWGVSVGGPQCGAILAARCGLVEAILRSNPVADHRLLDGLPHGVAYHHAGLTMAERELVEEGFRKGFISVLAATSTLAAGVNLPAGRVIIRSMSIGKGNLQVVQYRQMSGRAGRPGFAAATLSLFAALPTANAAAGGGSNCGPGPGSGMVIDQQRPSSGSSVVAAGRGVAPGPATRRGESFLVVKKHEKQRAIDLIKEELPHVNSQLHPLRDGGRGLLKAVLEMFGLHLCDSEASVMQYLSHTLLWRQAATEKIIHGGQGLGHAKGFGQGQTSASQLQPGQQGLGWATQTVEINAKEALKFLLAAHALELAHVPDGAPNATGQPTASSSSSSGSPTSSSMSNIHITRFGRAAIQSGISPDEAIVVYEDLSQALRGINLESDLHLLYLITPIEKGLYPDYHKLHEWYQKELNDSSISGRGHALKFVCDSVGLQTATLVRWSQFAPNREQSKKSAETVRGFSLSRWGLGANSSSSGNDGTSIQNAAANIDLAKEDNWKALLRTRRLWAAMALNAILLGQPATHVSQQYGCTLAELEELRRSAKLGAGRVQRFCAEVGWAPLERLINNFKTSAAFTGLSMDDLASIPSALRPLLQVPHLTPRVARALLDEAKINSLAALATCDVRAVAVRLQLFEQFEKQVPIPSNARSNSDDLSCLCYSLY